MTARPDVSVIAVAWNTAPVMTRALASLPAAAGDLEVEYIVVDNGSSDSSVADLRALRAPTVEVIELGRNTGFTNGVNVGLRHATGRFVLLCNPDVIAEPRSLERLVAALDDAPDAWAATPWFRNPDGSAQWFWRRLPGTVRFAPAYLRWGKWLDRRVGRATWKWRSYRDLADPPPTQPIDAVGAAFLLARAEDISDAGLLDIRYRNFFSDAALMRDRARAGRVLLGVGDVEVVHDRGVTFRSLDRWERDAEFLRALSIYVDGESAPRRWLMRAALALDLALPHPHRSARRQLVRHGTAGDRA